MPNAMTKPLNSLERTNTGDRRSKRTGGGAEFGPTWGRQRPGDHSG